MSNSIWKTGYPKYGHHRFGDAFVQEHHREDGSKFYVVGTCDEPNDRWAYLSDIIAQADKAERLEKENEAMREEFEVWHGNYECEVEEKKQLQKAVDLALGWLEKVATPAKCDDDLCREFTKRKIDEIKQLIKETTNGK